MMLWIDQIEFFILNSLQVVFDQFGWWGVLGMMAFENLTNLTPSEVVLGFAGWMLIEAHDLPFITIFKGGLFAGLGSLIGASGAYWISRLGGRPLIDRMARWVRLDPKHITRAEAQFQRFGNSVVFFGRMVPGVRTLISFPAGLAKMSYLKFVLATFAGAYFWCTLLLGAGFFLGKEWEILSAVMKQYAPYILALAVLIFIVYIFVQNRKRSLTIKRQAFSEEYNK